MRIVLTAVAMIVGIVVVGVWGTLQYDLGLPLILAVWTFLMFAGGLLTGALGVLWIMSRAPGNAPPGSMFDYSTMFPNQTDQEEVSVNDGPSGMADESSPIGGVASNV